MELLRVRGHGRTPPVAQVAPKQEDFQARLAPGPRLSGEVGEARRTKEICVESGGAVS